MPKFSYQVINQENRQLQGTIDAPDEQTARHELNLLGFSVISLMVRNDQVETETVEDNSQKFEFSAKDKTGKEIVGTIIGSDVFTVYKRLILEYQFEVHYLFAYNLTPEEKEKARVLGVDTLRDRLEEEKMVAVNLLKKQQVDEAEFAIKQEQLKKLVEFVLAKVNDFLNKYLADIKVEHKAKIKYHVDKILRIRNSTNLDYIKESCQDLLRYLQEQELFIHTDTHSQERNQMNLEVRSLMMQIRRADKTKPKDLFADLIEWRKTNVAGKANLPLWIQVVDLFLNLIFGPAETNPEKEKLLADLQNTDDQIKSFLIISVQSKEPQIRRDAFQTVLRLWQERKKLKKQLKSIDKDIKQSIIDSQENTISESVLKEFYLLAIWIFSFYTIYYFVSIYQSTKAINLPGLDRLPLVFQNPLIKYFYVFCFLFICFAGLKIEFLKRRKFTSAPLVVLFLFANLLIYLNF